MSKQRITCGITMGDAAGIGPEVILKALNAQQVQGRANFVLIGSTRVLQTTAHLLKIKLSPKITLFEVGNISKLTFGQANPRYGALALECINAALSLLKAQKIDVLVTAPVNKYTINQSGSSFTGHTEYLASATKTKNFAMMLVGGSLKVVLVTRHLALKDVAMALTKDNIYQTIKLTTEALKEYFAVVHPRIAVCGLNPHSGEEGVLGDEERKVIHPAIVRAQHLASLVGPLPADSLFYFAGRGKFDACVAMYHDQGLIPLKMFKFNQGVNLTLGLPFVRTSPDHGTAYNIAGKNQADPGSMIEAIKLAVKIGLKIKAVS